MRKQPRRHPADVVSSFPLMLLLCASVVAAPRTASRPAEAVVERLGNPFIRVQARGFTLHDVRSDAGGSDRFGEVLLDEIHAPAIRVRAAPSFAGPTRVEYRADLLHHEVHPLGSGNETVANLPVGGRIGFTYTVPEGDWISRVRVLVGTHLTKDSDVTLDVRRSGPDGEKIATQRFIAVPDNSWMDLPLAANADGDVWIGLSELKGQLSWWATRGPPPAGTRNTFNGQPNSDMTLRAELTLSRVLMPVTASWQLRYRELIGTLTPTAQPREAVPGSLTWEIRCPWQKEGYELVPATSAFEAFYSSSGQFITAHQMKRREHLGLRIGPAESITAWGLRGTDVRFAGPEGTQASMGLRAEPDRLVLAFDAATAPAEVGKPFCSIKITFSPRAEVLPGGFPYITCDDRRASELSSRFLWDRALSYPPPPGPSAWYEWTGLIRDWLHLPLLRDPERNVLATVPITKEGYVHTWGGQIGWPFPDNAKYDTRHFDSNARFILGAYRWITWRRDKPFLREQLARLRLAMEYQLGPLQGEKGLIISNSKNNQGRNGDLGGNYWDILPFGHQDAYCNIVYFASLHAMGELETLAGRWLTDAERNTQPPPRSPESYQQLRKKVYDAYNRTFWDEKAGRFIGCVDVDGNRHDYGFTFVNLEAMTYGLADREQARRIFQWMEHEPTSTGKADTYSAFIFAPRATTLHNPIKNDPADIARAGQPPWWHMDWGGTVFGDQCQDGGAILYTSYYDLMARATLIDPDNAWKRYREILDRYAMPDRLCGGPPLSRGEIPQQENPGAVGTDLPFPESGLVPAAMLYAFMGVMPEADGLRITPRIPSALKNIHIAPIAFGDYVLDINVRHAQVEISAKGPAMMNERRSFKRGESLLLEIDEGKPTLRP